MKLKSHLNAAKAVCLAAEGVGPNRNYKVGAILFKKGKILAAKSNSYKTHPLLLTYTSYPHLHAESACILGHGLDNCSGLSLLVTRLLKNQKFTMAKPCPACMEMIRDAQIKDVYYTNWSGKVVHLDETY